MFKFVFQTQHMKVTPILYSRPLSNGKHQIKIRIHQDGKTKFYTTSFSIEKNKWDKAKNKVKELKSIPEHESINDELDKLVRKFKKDTPKEEKSVRPYDFSLVIKEFDEHIRLLKSNDKYNTYRKFEVVKKHLLNFTEKEPGQTFINHEFLTKFQLYLFEVVKLKQNGVHTYFKVFRNIINKLIVANNPNFRQESNPFLNFKVKEEKVFKPKLTFEQLKQIIDYQFEPYTDLWHVKNYFLFSFYSGGMRIGDLIKLQWRNLIDGRLEYSMGKTSKPISLKINDKQLEILSIYFPTLTVKGLKDEPTELNDPYRHYHTGGMSDSLNLKFKPKKGEDLRLVILKQLQLKRGNHFVFPILNKQTFKDYKNTTEFLKSVSSKTAVINKSLKEISKVCEIGTNITFHIARHTFSDLMRKKGISIYDISKTLGHADISTTQKYLKSIDNESVDNSLNIFYKDL